MAGRLNPIRALVVLAAAGSWAADPLPDPTRPAIGVTQPGGAASAPVEAGPVLQSVMLPKQGKPVAIIDGERVELGGSFRGARVTRITETEVVLGGSAGRQVLRLTPAVEKRSAGVAPKGPAGTGELRGTR